MRKKIYGIGIVILGMCIAGTALAKQGIDDMANLGSSLYQDINLSVNQNQSCQTCHHPSSGFADPANRVDPITFPVSAGSVTTPIQLFGGLNAPISAYAGRIPPFHFDPVEDLFFGGVFWDGRATGWTLGDPLAEQALGPFQNPVEMGLTSEEQVIGIVMLSDYADKYVKVFGPFPIIDAADPNYSKAAVLAAYDNIGFAIAAFEKSDNLIKYSSKFDKFWAEQGGDVSSFGVVDGNYVGVTPGFKSKYLNGQELEGLALFNAVDKGNCAACHPTTNDGANPPLFTDNSYDNLGVPVNPQIAVLRGPQEIYYGLGANIGQLGTACSNLTEATDQALCYSHLEKGCDDNKNVIDALYPTAYADCVDNLGMMDVSNGLGANTSVYVGEAGKVKVPTVRNVGRSAPYAHNGYFITLAEIVNFYNTAGDGTWPLPEVPFNVNRGELGELGLSPAEEAAIVAFLNTLTD